MKRYDGILLCSDYDHTLTSYTYEYKPGDDRFACIPENNIEAVKRFTAAGGTFAVVSGRNPDEIEALKSIMPISDLCVCCNGTAVYSFSDRRAVLSYTMDERCLDAVRFFAPFADEYEFIRITDSDFKFTFFSSGDDLDTALSGPRFPAYKMVVEHYGRGREYAARHYAEAQRLFADRYSVEMSSPTTLEICPKGSGKGAALKAMLPLMGRSFDKIICAGDNQNDIGMIEFADVGYAVGNAIASLKEVADKVTADSSQGAIAAIISEL